MTEPRIARVFPRRTVATPVDALAFVGEPPTDGVPDVDEVHVSATFTWDLPEAERLVPLWRNVAPVVRLGGPATGESGGDFVPGCYLKDGYVITSHCRLHAMSFQTEKTVRAGKAHACDWCGEPILVGERYVRCVQATGARLDVVRLHHECDVAVKLELEDAAPDDFCTFTRSMPRGMDTYAAEQEVLRKAR